MYEEIRKQAENVANEICDAGKLKKGQILVVGCSSSEVCGDKIGTNSNLQVAEAVFEGIYKVTQERGIYLAAQCCEHLNRALVVERELAMAKDLEIVNVRPTLHVGGSGQLAAFDYMKDPVEVEEIVAQAGIDIGDTSIGMHVKRVQVPLRPITPELGGAHVTALASRPKLIGGARAEYLADPIRKN